MQVCKQLEKLKDIKVATAVCYRLRHCDLLSVFLARRNNALAPEMCLIAVDRDKLSPFAKMTRPVYKLLYNVA